MSNVGFRVYTKVNRPDPQLVERFKGIPVAVVGDEMNRTACMAARIKRMNKAPMLGVAITVRARGGDNLMLHRALDLAGPGDVIVVDGQGDLANALTGENMMTYALARGLAGVVIDGAIRDVEAISRMPMAVFAAGVQPNGPYKNGPGELNVPVSCGGVLVYPGDIVIGDDDGVVVVRPCDAAAVAERGHARHHKEEGTRQAIADGTYDRSAYTDAALRRLGCEVIDGAWDDGQ